jgi:hypothetical protein
MTPSSQNISHPHSTASDQLDMMLYVMLRQDIREIQSNSGKAIVHTQPRNLHIWLKLAFRRKRPKAAVPASSGRPSATSPKRALQKLRQNLTPHGACHLSSQS